MSEKRYDLRLGDCMDVMESMSDCSVDAVVSDPPYHLQSIVKRFGGDSAAPAKSGADGRFARLSKGFMGQEWDGGDIAFRVDLWRQVFRVLKPGGYLLAFSGTRTQHRMVCAIEDAGFDIRDQIGWVFGSGFNKLGYIAFKLEATLCDHRPEGNFYTDTGEAMRRSPPFRHPQADEVWGLAGGIKPAWEPICVARKPFEGSLVENVLAHGVGALNIDGCRVPVEDENYARNCSGDREHANSRQRAMEFGMTAGHASEIGRWPANLIHDGSPEVIRAFAAFGTDKGASGPVTRRGADKFRGTYGAFAGQDEAGATFHGDTGSAARFFYCAKATREDRDEGLGKFADQVTNVLARHRSRRMDEMKRPDGAEPAIGKNIHPTVKPTGLMRYLCRLVTPRGGLVLDPFMGSGSTGKAAILEGLRFIGVELSPEYLAVAAARIEHATAMESEESKRVASEARAADDRARQGDMFAKPAAAPPKMTQQDLFVSGRA